jgi:hypothetical protein
VPPEALTADQMITVTSSSDPPPPGYLAFTPVYRFGPDGLVFTRPVAVFFELPAGVDNPVVVWSLPDRAGYQVIGGVVEGSRIRAEVTHFSDGFGANGTASPDAGVADLGTNPPPDLAPACSAGETACPAVGCVNLKATKAHCGSCGRACMSFEICFQGDCGSCGAGMVPCESYCLACAGGQVCVNGQCM